MSSLKELRKQYKDQEKAKKRTPFASPPISEVGSAMFGSATSDLGILGIDEEDSASH